MQPAQRWPHLLVYTRHGGDNEYICLYGGGSVNRPLICRLRERRLLVLLLSVQAFSNGIVAAGKGVARCYCAYKSTRCGKLLAVVQSSPGQNKGGRRLQVSRFSGRIMGWRDGGILARKYGIGKDRNVLRLSLSLLFVGFYIILVLVCSLA